MFKEIFGQSPSAFRKKPDWVTWDAQFHWISRKETEAMQVRIVTTESALVAVLEHRGDPAPLNTSVQRFIAWRKESGLSPVNSSHTYGIAYDDPTAAPAADFRFEICGSVSAPVPPNRYGVITNDSGRPLRRGPPSGLARSHQRQHLSPLPELAAAQRRRTARLSGLLPLPESQDRYTRA